MKARAHSVCLLLGITALLVALLLPYLCEAVADASATGYLAGANLETVTDHVPALYTAFERADPNARAAAHLQPVGRGQAPGSRQVFFNLGMRATTSSLAAAQLQTLITDLQKDLARRDIPTLTVTSLGKPVPIHTPWGEIMVILSGYLNWVSGFCGLLLIVVGLWQKGKALPPPLAREKAETSFDY